jgi:hypothetical protein
MIAARFVRRHIFDKRSFHRYNFWYFRANRKRYGPYQSIEAAMIDAVYIAHQHNDAYNSRKGVTT